MKTVTKEEYQEDLVKGYIPRIMFEKRQQVIRDRATGMQIVRQVPEEIFYQCMRCQFDSQDEKLMLEHLTNGEHPWRFTPFENPYGHISEVVIEGIEDYSTIGDQDYEPRS